MKKLIALKIVAGSCLLLACVSSALSQTESAGSNGAPSAEASTNGAPRIQFASTVYDFGRIKAGEPIKVDFVFTNIGNQTLEITEVKPHCGCTVAGAWDKTVEPGGTGTIPLQVNSGNFNGLISKSAAVTCNDPVQSKYSLIIKGAVWRPVEIKPNVVSFSYPADQPISETHVVTILNNADDTMTISELKSGNPAFKVELKEVKPGKEFELAVTSVPESINGRVQSTITFKTSSSDLPLGSINVFANPIEAKVQQQASPGAPTVRSSETNAAGQRVIRIGPTAASLAPTAKQ